MTDTAYITIRSDDYDDLVAKYLKAKDTIMVLELEIFELQEELASIVSRLEDR